MTTEQIKKAVFAETQQRGAKDVATELGLSEEILTGWLISNSPMDMSVVQKAASLYLEVAQLANRPHEVLMGKPPESNVAQEPRSIVPDGFNGGANPLPRAALAGAPPLAPQIPEKGAMTSTKDEPPIDNVKESARAKEFDPVPTPIASKVRKIPERNVCLLFPIYKSVDPSTFMTILAFWDKATMRAELSPGDAMIARSRNRLARRFLETDAEWSLWLDDDLVFPCGSAGLYRYLVGAVDPFQKKPQAGHWANSIDDKFLNYSTPSRLISHGKTLVAGSYWDRWGKNTITAVYSQGPQNRIPSDSLHSVDFAGTGCMLVHRKVYEDIAAKFPGIWPEKGETQFFTPIEGKERMWGEDQSFCWRAKEAGHPTYLDLGLICGHMGMQCFGVPSK